ncbi:hypothetical protein MRB53_038243 [Persea americana]|nr:hypothetical protein MRB53_038243 [Persea americana]
MRGHIQKKQAWEPRWRLCVDADGGRLVDTGIVASVSTQYLLSHGRRHSHGRQLRNQQQRVDVCTILTGDRPWSLPDHRHEKCNTSVSARQ